MDKLKVETKDAVEWAISDSVTSKIPFLSDMAKTKKVVLETIPSEIFKAVVNYIEYHNSVPTDTQQWDKVYIDQFNGSQLIELIHAAMTLRVEPLLLMASTHLKSTIVDNEPHVIREKLQLPNSFKDGEEDELNNEYRFEKC